jgi:KAP family P-loop domain
MPSQSNEFIDDRSIEEKADDRFRHEDVVAELAHLVDSREAQTNIALFAPWGSGKTGISKLLRSRLEDKRKGCRYVYFDAFKHRDTPLRRSFLRAVATGLDEDPSEIDALSREEVTQELGTSDWKRVAQFVAGALAVGIVLMALLSLILAWIRPEAPKETFGESFVVMFTRLSGVATLVAALIGVVVSGLLGGVTATRKQTPLSEDDEFEEAFGKLAEKARRLVIFIDELDRCAADEVVETLETMRVFLDVPNCIFIVAADRQALEAALRRRARQETPADEVHPYFSSAGAYVDKIFQFQIALPPLRWTDTGEFAENLVKNRGGLWKELRERDEMQDVLTALIPTHVTSPRRVKVLLNSYVIAHRLAERRATAEEMADLSGRAAALAQLVCLGAEFPLYADELERFTELPAATLAVAQKDRENKLRTEAPEVWERAVDFIERGRPLVPLLYDTPGDGERGEPRQGSSGEESSPSEGDADSEPAESSE